MPFTFGNLTNSLNWNTAAGNASIAMASAATNGTQIVGVIFATATTGAFGMTDNHPDGLGTYTRVCTVLDAASANQMTVLIRDHLIGTTSGTVPTQTTTGISGGTNIGIGCASVTGVGAGFVGLPSIRQFGTAPNVAAGVAPIVNLTYTVFASSALLAWTMRDDATTSTNGPSGFNNFIGTSNAVPAVAQRAHTLTSGGLGNSFLWTTTPGVTSCAVLLEFNNLGPPSFGVSAPVPTALFPKPVLRGVV